MTLKGLLIAAGVSKTAFYNLLYKESLLPGSIHALAASLDVKPSAFLEETSPKEEAIMIIAKLTDEIMKEYQTLDRENVRHTLLLLQEEPIERLRRGLIRGQKFNLRK